MAKLVKTDISNIAGKYYKGPKEIMLDREVYAFSIGDEDFVAYMDWTDGKYKVWNVMKKHFKMPKNPDALTIHTVQHSSPLKTGNTGYEVRYKSGEPGYDTLEQAKKSAIKDYKNLTGYLTAHNESTVSRIENILLKEATDDVEIARQRINKRNDVKNYNDEPTDFTTGNTFETIRDLKKELRELTAKFEALKKEKGLKESTATPDGIRTWNPIKLAKVINLFLHAKEYKTTDEVINKFKDIFKDEPEIVKHIDKFITRDEGKKAFSRLEDALKGKGY